MMGKKPLLVLGILIILFGFGISTKEYNEIKKGFYVKYTGMNLYSYSLN